MGRIPPVETATMTPEQKSLSARISGPRSGETRGPFPIWLRAPELLDRVNELALYFKEERALPARLRELAILVNARHWSSEYQWHVHLRHARRLGLDAAALDAIVMGTPARFPDPAEQAVYEFCCELLGPSPVSDATHARACELLSEDGVIELVTLAGFYSLIAVGIKGSDVGLPEGQAPYLTSR
jgi:4-carboxymuconolactone decarboxylase